MKKIVPFNNVLQFNTDVKEITSISLEHKINKYPDTISGVFYISGEYKITDGQLDREKFNFELPFDIALSSNYRNDTLLVDIDDFRYDLISDKQLKVNIDLYIDGEVEEPLPRVPAVESLDKEEREELYEEDLELTKDLLLEDETEKEPEEDIVEPERIDLLKEMLTTNKEDTMKEDINITNDNDNQNVNNNILNPDGDDEYVTYRVYKVVEGDTLDTILTKYNITKDMLADYNNVENINPGDKLIIPTNEK